MIALLRAIGLLSLAGVADSIYGVTQHFGSLGSGGCNWGGRISCDIVNKSVFSEIGGVPVALVGVIGYAAIFAAAVWMLHRQPARGHHVLLALSLGGLAFSFYLSFIELYMLRAYCPICIVSQTIILVIAGLSWVVTRRTRALVPEEVTE